MGWKFIAQVREPTRATIWRLLAQLTDLADERVDLLLLLKDGLVELLHPIFGEAGFDL